MTDSPAPHASATGPAPPNGAALIAASGAPNISHTPDGAVTSWNPAAAQRTGEQQLALALEAAGAGTWEAEPATGVFIASDRALALIGLPPGTAMTHETALACVHPEDRARVEAAVASALETGLPYNVEMRTMLPDGSVRWHASRAIAAESSTGKRLIGLVQDITDRRQAEERLRESEAFSRSVLESSPDCVKVIAADGTLEFMNGNGMGLMEIDDFSLCAGRPWTALWPAETRQSVADSIARAKQGSESRFEAFCPTAKGTPKWWDVAVRPVLDAAGRCARIVSVSRDITARKQAEEALRASEAKARAAAAEIESIYASAHAGLCVLDRDLRFLRINDRLAEINGVPAAVHIGRTVREVVPALANAAEALAKRIFETGEPILNLEITGETPAQPGVQRHWVEQWMPLRDAAGAIIGINVAAEEATARKQAEAALAASLERLEAAEYATNALIYDAAQGKVWRGSGLTRLLGWGAEEVPATIEAWQSLWHPDDLAHWKTLNREAMADSEGRYAHEYRVRHKDGHYVWLMDRGRFGRDASGGERLIGTSLDITERKRAEVDLRDRNTQLELILDAAFAIAYEWDVVADRVRRLHSSEPALPETGPRAHTFEDVVAKVHPDDRALFRANVQAALEGPDGAYHSEHRLVRPDGGVVWITEHGRAERDSSGQAVRLLGISFDITERKEAEAALRASEDKFAKLFHQSPVAKTLTRLANGRVVDVNRAWEELTGFSREEAIGRTTVEFGLMDAAEREKLLTHMQSGPDPGPLKVNITIRSGERRVTLSSLRVIETGGQSLLMSSNMDITSLEQAQERERLLMREVNHRSKNMLALVQAVARQTQATGKDSFLARFNERIASLAQAQYLLIAHHWQKVPVEGLVRSQLSHFADLVGTRITLEGPNVFLVPAATQGIGMAIHELATNAAKYGALSSPAGRIAISWRVEADGAGTRFAMSWRERGGPPAEAPTRHGFGSTVTTRMVEMQMSGKATANYAPEGFSWTLECPAAGLLADQPEQARAAPPAAHAAAKTQGARILVVEDEPLFAIETAALLTEAGYRVIGPAATVAAALALIARDGCDAAVLDVNLGPETSEPVARQLLDTGTPFIVVTGYSRSQLPDVFQAAPLIGKPHGPEALKTALTACLRDAVPGTRAK